MSLRQSNQSLNDWGWLRETDSTSLDDLSVNGIGVLAIHLHYLRINKPFIQLKDIHQHDVSIDTFRLCISVYALSRYSKTIRVYPTESNARFDQTMQMLIRIYDQRHDQRHLIHVILYGYLTKEKRYALIADQVIDSIKLVHMRHISEAIIFEGSADIYGQATLFIELVFVYGRHGYNFSSQLIFQNDRQVSDTVKNQTLFERVLPTSEDRTTNGKFFQPSEIDLPLFLKYSFDELEQHVADTKHEQRNIDAILDALSSSAKYSTMSAILDMYPLRKQRLEILFDFLSEGPYLPEQNIVEPTAPRLIPWSITYWKRALSGVPLHGSALDMTESRHLEDDINHLKNTSPILRQIIVSFGFNRIKDLLRRVMNFIYHQKQSHEF